MRSIRAIFVKEKVSDMERYLDNKAVLYTDKTFGKGFLHIKPSGYTNRWCKLCRDRYASFGVIAIIGLYDGKNFREKLL